MTWIPNWYALVLLSLAAWRTFQLLSDDDILDRPRRWVLGLGNDWEKDGDPVPEEYKIDWAKFLICPYCFGFWISIWWYLAWLAWDTGALVLATPLAISALVVAQAKILSREE